MPRDVGGRAKKTLIKSLAWKGCTRSAVRRGQGEGARHIYNKRQVTELNFVYEDQKSAQYNILYLVSFKMLFTI